MSHPIDQVGAHMRRALLTLVCLLGPVAAMVIAIPIAMLPLEAWTQGAGEYPARYLLLAAPAYLSIAAAPGYVYCLLSRNKALNISSARRWWIRSSMAMATACSAVGLWAATLMWLFGPPSLASLICTIILWRRFERRPVRAASAV